jgi:uncharacterized membrane protein
MHTLVKTACAVHNLSLATAFGGPLFAKLALRPAVIREIKDEKERGRVLACAWTKYSKINVPAHLLFTATWSIERQAIKHMHVDRRTIKLVHLKDLLIAGALVTGVANVIVGKMVKRDFPEGVPVTDKPSTDPRLEKYRRYFRVMGPANLVLVGASLAIGPFIAGRVIHSLRKNALTRLLSR